MLALTDLAAKANRTKLPCRHEYAPSLPQYARSAEAMRNRLVRIRRHRSQNPSIEALIGDLAAARRSTSMRVASLRHPGVGLPGGTWND